VKELERELDANNAWTEHLSECDEQIGYMRGQRDAFKQASDLLDRRADARASLPQGKDWMSVEFVTAANEIRALRDALIE
jgi:hypothetical protein